MPAAALVYTQGSRLGTFVPASAAHQAVTSGVVSVGWRVAAVSHACLRTPPLVGREQSCDPGRRNPCPQASARQVLGSVRRGVEGGCFHTVPTWCHI